MAAVGGRVFENAVLGRVSSYGVAGVQENILLSPPGHRAEAAGPRREGHCPRGWQGGRPGGSEGGKGGWRGLGRGLGRAGLLRGTLRAPLHRGTRTIARHCTAAHAPCRMRMLATRGCVIKHPDWEGDADSATKRLALLTRWGGVNATHAEGVRLGGPLPVAPPRPLAVGGGVRWGGVHYRRALCDGISILPPDVLAYAQPDPHRELPA